MGAKGKRARIHCHFLPYGRDKAFYGPLLSASGHIGRRSPSHIADGFTVTCRLTTMGICHVYCPQNVSKRFSSPRFTTQMPLIVHTSPYQSTRVTRTAGSPSITCFQDTVRRAASIPEIKVIVLCPPLLIYAATAPSEVESLLLPRKYLIPFGQTHLAVLQARNQYGSGSTPWSHAVLLQDRAKSLGIEFRPLNPVFGAEVLGVDLSQPLPASTKSLLQVCT